MPTSMRAAVSPDAASTTSNVLEPAWLTNTWSAGALGPAGVLDSQPKSPAETSATVASVRVRATPALPKCGWNPNMPPGRLVHFRPGRLGAAPAAFEPLNSVALGLRSQARDPGPPCPTLVGV